MNISVYITSYNQKEFLREAIESVLSQTLKPFEIIIVDDASKDGSQEMIRSYQSRHPELIRAYCFEFNQGVTRVRRKALSEVKGDHVTYVDGDDLYLPHKLELEAKLMRKQGTNLVFTNNMYVNPDDINDIKWIWASNSIDLTTDLFLKTLTRDYPRNSLFRMELVNFEYFKSVGFHDPNLSIYEDYELRIRLSKKACMNYSLEPTTKIRISKEGLSKSPKDLHESSFKYIYNKYAPEIDKMPPEQKKTAHAAFQYNFDNFSGNVSFRSKMKSKLIRLINSF